MWVIQINPTSVESLPKTNSQIFDRRNQMEGNVSLQQSLEFVEFCNLLLREKAVSDEVLDRIGFTRRQPIAVRFVRMSPELQSTLDYVSKLSTGTLPYSQADRRWGKARPSLPRKPAGEG